MFREVTTLPLETFVNEGSHRVDLAARTIFNDEHWKGWLPKGLVFRDIFARLATGYAKRFWKQGNRYLGETLYVDGRIKVKHSLEEFTLDRPVNDLDPGKYILLRYTDPVFEHLFYDVMKAADDGVIVYGGYTGRFPGGKRGFTGVLMRRYSFAELGERDHEQRARKGKRPAKDALKTVWARTPDLILLDLHMPGLGGLEALPRILRASPRSRVVVFSAMAATRMLEAALDAGATGYIVKGVSPKRIAEHLHRVAKAGSVRPVQPWPLAGG